MNAKRINDTESSALLYRISKAMAAVKDGRELLKIVIAETQQLFGFYDIGLSVLDKSGLHYVDWSVFYEDINPSGANLAQREKLIYGISVDEPLLKYSHARFEAEKRPFIENMTAECIEKYKDFPHLPIEIEHGYKQFLVTTLKFGGQTLGVSNFNSLKENHFDDCDFELFQAIADLVAVAVANITANEEIIEREREKSVLLSISSVIATVRSKEDLLQLIIEKIKPALNFYDCGIFVFDREKAFLEDLTVSLPKISPSEANIQLAQRDAAIFSFKGSVWEQVFEKVRTAGKPIIVNYKRNDISGWNEYVQTSVIEKIGYEDCLTTILTIGGEEIGAFAINSLDKGTFSESQFVFFQNIANQMAVAVANVLANEEILERTREKSILLSISEDIASARNAVELLQIIRQKAQKLIPFYDTGILIVEESGEYHYDLAVNLQGWDESESNQKLQALGLNRILHADSYVEFAMQLMEKANGPIIEDYEKRLSEFDYPFFTVLREFGYKEGICAALKSGGKTFGTFWLNSITNNHFKLHHFEIFQALADQVAVAVSNILANDEIKRQLNEITELKKRLEEENTYLVEEVTKNYNFTEIVGTSARLKEIFEVIETVAPTDATVLIQGETGTGKELIARAIHNQSTRNGRPLIKVNCAALPIELVESELFGHERGSFTGAHERRIGKFELADNGTIFLDEIGELPLEIQVKMLRVLQEKEIERLGGKGTIKLNLRVIAATNRNLAQEVQAGRFRADLYYRLCTVELFLPLLNQRPEDIKPLTLHFAQKYAAKFSREIKSVSSDMLSELNNYHFPGNVRELEHIVENAVLFSRNEQLILPRSLSSNQIRENGNVPVSEVTRQSPIDASIAASMSLEEVERQHIKSVLQRANGRIKGNNGAAEILGLNPATLYFRMKKLGIENPR